MQATVPAAQPIRSSRICWAAAPAARFSALQLQLCYGPGPRTNSPDYVCRGIHVGTLGRQIWSGTAVRCSASPWLSAVVDSGGSNVTQIPVAEPYLSTASLTSNPPQSVFLVGLHTPP